METGASAYFPIIGLQDRRTDQREEQITYILISAPSMSPLSCCFRFPSKSCGFNLQDFCALKVLFCVFFKISEKNDFSGHVLDDLYLGTVVTGMVVIMYALKNYVHKVSPYHILFSSTILSAFRRSFHRLHHAQTLP